MFIKWVCIVRFSSEHCCLCIMCACSLPRNPFDWYGGSSQVFVLRSVFLVFRSNQIIQSNLKLLSNISTQVLYGGIRRRCCYCFDVCVRFWREQCAFIAGWEWKWANTQIFIRCGKIIVEICLWNTQVFTPISNIHVQYTWLFVHKPMSYEKADVEAIPETCSTYIYGNSRKTFSPWMLSIKLLKCREC